MWRKRWTILKRRKVLDEKPKEKTLKKEKRQGVLEDEGEEQMRERKKKRMER